MKSNLELNPEKKRGLLSVYIIILSVVVYICFSKFYLEPNNKKEILEDYTITSGQFTNFGQFDVGINTSTKFKYEFREITYEKDLNFKVPCKNFNSSNIDDVLKLKLFEFPVAVSNSNPRNAFPLFRPTEFEIIGQQFPDSLLTFYSNYLDCNLVERFIY